MSLALKLMNVALWFVIFVAAVNIAYALVGGYMVASGQAFPGEPIYLDELAPELGHAVAQGVISFGVICLAIVGRWQVRRYQNAS